MKSNQNTKRKIFVTVTAGMLALAMILGPIDSFANGKKGKFIGETKAKQIALSNAGLKESDVSLVRVGLRLDGGRYEYDVEFHKGNVEYDYEIDAKTGKIVDFDKDIENFVINNNNNNNNNNHSTALDKAKEIALKHVGLQASQVIFTKAKLDKEDGRSIYDVEFYSGDTEYEFEIDAKTGKILDFDYEKKGDQDDERYDDQDDDDDDDDRDDD